MGDEYIGIKVSLIWLVPAVILGPLERWLMAKDPMRWDSRRL